MSNARLRAVYALSATFRHIEGINDTEAAQSAEYVVEQLIAAMGVCGAPQCEKKDSAGHCTQSPCIYHSARSRLGCLAECHIGADTCKYRDKLHPTCYRSEPCYRHVVVAVPDAKAPCINSDCPDWGSGDICKAGSICSNQVLAAPEQPRGGLEEQPDGVVAFMEAPEPCNEPCTNTECMNHSEGDKCLNHGLCEDHIPPEPCNESCANSKCEFNEEDGNLCLQLEPCGLIMAPDTLPPCEEPCSKTTCGENEGGLLCMAPTTCTDHSEPEQPEERLQGYTPEEWEQIRAGGFLCQFSNSAVWSKPVAALKKVRPDVGYNFESASGKNYQFCRPAELPGVLRPWFGGDCPVPDDTPVAVQYSNGTAAVDSAGRFATWGKNIGGPRIKAFMVLPE